MLDALTDGVRFLQIVPAQHHFCLQKAVPARVASCKCLDLSCGRIVLDDLTHLSQCLCIQRCVQQDAHPVLQELPTGPGDEEHDEQRRRPIQAQPKDVTDEGDEDDTRGEDVGAVLLGVGDQAGGVGRLSSPQLRMTEHQGDDGRQHHARQHPRIDGCLSLGGEEGFLDDLEGGEEDQACHPYSDHILNLVQAVGEGSAPALRDLQASQHRH